MNLKFSSIVALICFSTAIQASKPQVCPDMSFFKGQVPSGWHVRFNEPIKPNSSSSLQIIIMEVVEKNQKNNFYCRYIDDQGKTFVLSKKIKSSDLMSIHKKFWKYDNADHIWECIPKAKNFHERLQQCSFGLK